jgi:hypothetical protein
VLSLERREDGFLARTPAGDFAAGRVVLATGGLSLPKTGSDGHGLAMAASLGHRVVATTPALVPLVLEGTFHRGLSGIAHEVELTLRVDETPAARVRGPLLWTHFGVSGPAVLDLSRFWCRARLEGRDARVSLCFLPGSDFEKAEKGILAVASERPRVRIQSALAERLPQALARAVLEELEISHETPVGRLARDERRRLVRALLDWPIPIARDRGYSFAEVTAGGIPLDEVDPRTMASRSCSGLYLVGEILDVDGRIGGFNFQWAWSTGFVAGTAITK